LKPKGPGQDGIEKLGPYFFVQKKAGLRLTNDTAALADFAARSLTEKDTVIDLGTATGAILLMLAWKTPAGRMTGVEVDREAAEAARENVETNGLEGRVSVLNADYRDLPGMYEEGAFTAVVSNPPYTKAGAGRLSPKAGRAAARSEVMGSLAELVAVSSYLAGKEGKMFFVYPVARLSELLAEAGRRGLNVRRLRFIHTGKNKEARLFLVELGQTGGLRMEEPLFY